MKILYLHQYFNTPAMAGGTRSYEMARRLVDRGHEVHIVTSIRDPSVKRSTGWEETEEGGIRVHWVPVPYENSMPYSRRVRSFLAFAAAAARRGTTVGGDLVFATSTPLTIALPAIYIARRHRVPMVFEVRDLWPAAPIAIGALRNPVAKAAAKVLERQAYFNAAHIVALAPGMKEDIVRDTGYPAESITVIPNGCDLELFDAARDSGAALRRMVPWLGDRPLVVYIGGIARAFGVDYLVRLAQAVRLYDRHVRFAVIGGGGDEPRVRQLARDAGILDDNFRMLGALPKQETPPWLAAADIATALFTGPRVVWKDGVQNKIFDALASGTPVAANYPGWGPLLLEEHGAGLVLDAEDPSRAAVSLLEVLADEHRLRGMAQAAQALARERFDRDALAGDLERVLLNTRGQNQSRD